MYLSDRYLEMAERDESSFWQNYFRNYFSVSYPTKLLRATFNLALEILIELEDSQTIMIQLKEDASVVYPNFIYLLDVEEKLRLIELNRDMVAQRVEKINFESIWILLVLIVYQKIPVKVNNKRLSKRFIKINGNFTD